MASSIRLPTAGASYRLTSMPTGTGAGFSMGLVLSLCGGLIACFALLCAQMWPPAQTVAVAPAVIPDEVFNARYYPLVDSKRFHFPRRLLRFMYPPQVILPEPPEAEILPTADSFLKLPLHPVSFPAEAFGAAPAAEAGAAPAPEAEK